MAESTAGNGPDGTPPAGGAASQQLVINAQYIKDLSFENPRAPQSLSQPSAQPAVEINVDVKAQNLGSDMFEVVLTVHASASVDAGPLFLAELVYGAVVTIRNVPPAMLRPVVLVETPRLMFPFARNIVAQATRDGGFPPLMINPIDFAELLRREEAASPDPPPNAVV